jgi:hypothetical protein
LHYNNDEDRTTHNSEKQMETRNIKEPEENQKKKNRNKKLTKHQRKHRRKQLTGDHYIRDIQSRTTPINMQHNES